MNQKEWLDYFETINDRKPTPAEMQEALANGDFVDPDGDSRGLEQAQVVTEATNTGAEPAEAVQVSVEADQAGVQSQPAPKKKLSKKAKVIIGAVAGVLAFVLLSVGGFTLWTYQSGKIPTGTYQLSSYYYYDDEDKEVDFTASYTDNGMEMLDFVTVTGNKVKSYSYTKSGSIDLVNALDYETENEFTANPWSHTLLHAWTLTEYEEILDEVLDNQYKNFEYASTSDVKNLKDSYIDSYKEVLSFTYRYKFEGNTLTITNYNKKGQKISERTFKRLSEEESEKLTYDYDKAVRKNKELYGS